MTGERRARSVPASAEADRRGVRMLVAIGTVAMNFLMLCIWAWWAFGTHNGFADMSVDMLKDPAVRAVVAEQIVDVLKEQKATKKIAVASAPALKPIIAELVVDTDMFRGLFYAGARHLHEVIFLGARSRMLVQVDGAGQMVKESLNLGYPTLADKIPPKALTIAVGLSQDTRLDTVVRAASITGWLLWPLGAIAVGAYAAALIRSRDRRRTVLRIGLGLAASGLFWIVILIVGVAVVSRMVDGAEARAAVRAVFRSVTHVLLLTARVVFSGGLVITTAALVAGEERVRARVQDALAWVRMEWNRPKLHGILGALVVTVGIVVAVYPEVMVAVVARSIGLVLAFLGLVAVLDVVGAHNWSGAGDGRQSNTVRRVAVFSTGVLASVSVLFGFGGYALYRAMHTTNAASADPSHKGCNEHIELCDLRLDQVVFAGTHNSMAASAEDGWWVPRQTGGIGAQLAAGVRAFLIDAHYGTRIGSLVRTDVESEINAVPEAAELSPENREVYGRMLAFIGAAGPQDAENEVFLCHAFCELGYTPAVDVFAKINGFLRGNPNEVIIIVVEDHVTWADLEAAVRRAHLDQRVFRYIPGQPLPTLREMIENRQNVVLMAEHQGGQAGWYPAGYEGLLVDTQYQFDAVAEFNCTVYRGVKKAPLLLVNHWLSEDPASPTVAAEVNSYEVLRQRVKACEVAGHGKPSIVAVDFYESGDLFDVVDELNNVNVP